jgi:hypothetical protein
MFSRIDESFTNISTTQQIIPRDAPTETNTTFTKEAQECASQLKL